MRSAEGKETELKWQINAPALSRSVKAIVDSAFRKGAEPLSPHLESLVLAAMISTSRNGRNGSSRNLLLSFEAFDESLTTR